MNVVQKILCFKLCLITISLTVFNLTFTSCSDNSVGGNSADISNIQDSAVTQNGGSQIGDPEAGEIGDPEVAADAVTINLAFLQTTPTAGGEGLLTTSEAQSFVERMRFMMLLTTYGRINMQFTMLPNMTFNTPCASSLGTTTINTIAAAHPELGTNFHSAVVLLKANCPGQQSGNVVSSPFDGFMEAANSKDDMLTSPLDSPTQRGAAYVLHHLMMSWGTAPFYMGQEGRTLLTNWQSTGSVGTHEVDWFTYNGRWSVMGDVSMYGNNQPMTNINTAQMSPINMLLTGLSPIHANEIAHYTSGTMNARLGRYNTRRTPVDLTASLVLQIDNLVLAPPIPYFYPEYFQLYLTLRRALNGDFYLVADYGHHSTGMTGSSAMQVGEWNLSQATMPLQIDFTAANFTKHFRLNINSLNVQESTADIAIQPLP
jgi:hypothetical protein